MKILVEKETNMLQRMIFLLSKKQKRWYIRVYFAHFAFFVSQEKYKSMLNAVQVDIGSRMNGC